MIAICLKNVFIICIFLNYLFEIQSYKDRRRDRETLVFHLPLTPQVAAKAMAGPGGRSSIQGQVLTFI